MVFGPSASGEELCPRPRLEDDEILEVATSDNSTSASLADHLGETKALVDPSSLVNPQVCRAGTVRKPDAILSKISVREALSMGCSLLLE